MSGAEILKGGVLGGNGAAVEDGHADGRVDGLAVLDSYHSEKCSLYNGDSCEIIKGISDNSVHLSVYSPPFSNLYIYSSSERDMGNANDDGEFAEHFRYLVPELLRITIPGRLMCVHCKDLPLYWGRDGAAGLKDFPGDLIRIFTSCGWTYHSRITIWKDPVTEMERTKNHGLLYKSLCADSCNGRQGMADYVLVFRKWNDEKLFVNPVLSEDGDPERFRIGEYIGTNPPADYEGRRDFSIQVWRKYASPVWFDIDQMDVLNYRNAKGDSDKHICPLQLGVIRRCVHLWSNPGDIIFTPFAGVGSEPVVSIEMGRKAIGIELKDSYFRHAVNRIKIAENESNRPRFDFMKDEKND